MNEIIKQRIDTVRRGEVPEGYLRTRAGIMPTDWPTKTLAKDVFKSHTNKKHGGAYEVLSATQDRGIIPRKDVDIDIKYDEENISSYKKVDEGDFVISLRSFQGGIEYSEYEGLVSPAYTVLKATKPIDDNYYRVYFKTADFIKRLNGAVYGIRDGKQIGFEDFGDLAIHYPPLAEQQKIAEILSTCDRVIELKQQLLDEKRKQKQWLMQMLLDPNSGVRLPGFENSTWKTATISSLFTFGSSLSKSRDELSDEGDLYLHYGDIHASSHYYIDAQADYALIPKYDGISPDKTHLRTGDVVFVDASEDYEGISKFVVIDNCDGLIFISGLHTIPCHSRDDRLTLHFKRYCFQTYSFKKQMVFYANGMKVYGISEKDFEKIEISFPEHKEQTAIADVLDTISINLELLENEIAEMVQKKKALMQLLLTGLVRVNA